VSRAEKGRGRLLRPPAELLLRAGAVGSCRRTVADFQPAAQRYCSEGATSVAVAFCCTTLHFPAIAAEHKPLPRWTNRLQPQGLGQPPLTSNSARSAYCMNVL
jgi:hypothetical protein